jgi:Flp pilus assembly protein TadG
MNGFVGLWRKIPRLLKDRSGLAAVEFALIAPLLLAMYFVTMEMSLGIEANKKVGRIGSMVADIVTQQSTLTKSDLEAIMQLGQAVIQPYGRSKPKIIVTAVEITNDATPKVQVVWSRQMSEGIFTVPYAVKSTVVIPDQLKLKGTFLIRVESYLEYKPLITWSASQKKTLGLTSAFDNISMGSTYYLRPRTSSTITCGDC